MEKKFISKESKLFDEIKHNYDYSDFIRDGIINYNEYMNSPLKILYILREAKNDSGIVHSGEEDLREYLVSGGSSRGRDGRAEQGVTRDIEAIEAAFNGKLLSYSDLKGISIDRRKNTLNKIIWFNLKKECNQTGSNPDWNLITKETIENSDIYKKLFSFYNPDIIVCGGTYGSFRLLYPDLLPENLDNHFIESIINGKKTIVFDFNHPAARSQQIKKMYDIRTAALKALYNL